MDGLNAIFSPESIAVIGASSVKGKVGHDIFENILTGGYQGTLYPVNPKAKSVLSVKCYGSIGAIPDPIDLAMIILPPRAALASIHDCVEKKVKGVVVISAGFKEVGGEGAVIEAEMAKICQESGIKLVGPNCLGVINPAPEVSLNASFSARMPRHGNISFISQSGALCTSVLDFAAARGFGFSKFVSIGNKADVDNLDLMRYYHQDPNTDVIMMYLEDLAREGEEFIKTVKEITTGPDATPVLCIKSGTSIAGAAAAASHTGALAGTDAVYNALFDQSGIIRCASVNQLFDYAEAYSAKKVPAGKQIAIITNAGGPGIIATDMTEHSGLELAKFSDETVEELKRYLPPTANFSNPVDVIGDAASDRYENSLATVISDRNVDGVLIILTPQSMTDAIGTAKAIVKISQNTPKPIVCSFMGILDVSAGVKILHDNMVPVYDFPENGARALWALYQLHKWKNRRILPQYPIDVDRDSADELIKMHVDNGKEILNEQEGAELLKCYGFNTLPMEVAGNRDDAAAFAEEIGFPVVMKIVSPQILHKSDAGGVEVGVASPDDVRASFDRIVKNAGEYNKEAEITGVLVQKMAARGTEVILGASRFPGFGHLVMFGLGGIFVELFKDVTFRLVPMGRNDARRMVKSIKGYPMLTGFRGRPVADIEEVEKMLVRLSKLLENHPIIKEIDINPLLVHEKGEGATVADVVITLVPPENGIS